MRGAFVSKNIQLHVQIWIWQFCVYKDCQKQTMYTMINESVLDKRCIHIKYTMKQKFRYLFFVLLFGTVFHILYMVYGLPRCLNYCSFDTGKQ